MTLASITDHSHVSTDKVKRCGDDKWRQKEVKCKELYFLLVGDTRAEPQMAVMQYMLTYTEYIFSQHMQQSWSLTNTNYSNCNSLLYWSCDAGGSWVCLPVGTHQTFSFFRLHITPRASCGMLNMLDPFGLEAAVSLIAATGNLGTKEHLKWYFHDLGRMRSSFCFPASSLLSPLGRDYSVIHDSNPYLAAPPLSIGTS